MTLQEARREPTALKPWVPIAIAGMVTLLATVAYLALVQNFEWKWLLASVFAAVSLSIVCYWIPGEPRWISDDIELPADLLPIQRR